MRRIGYAAIAALGLLLSLAGLSAARQNAPRGAEDARPVVDDSKVAPEKAAASGLPTLYVVGDSTLKSDAPMRGWGQEIGAFFDPAKINVVNRAIGGRSSRTFQNEGRWDKVLAELKPGDFVLVQFGHNDVGRYDDPAAKGRPSLHGEGEETAEVTKADGTKETVHTFGWYMRRYGADARARGATVIFCSMIPHKDWKDGKIQRGERDSFVQWTASAAKTTGAALIDLNEMVAEEYEKLGPEKVEAFFADRRTHTTPAGAELNARFVVAGLRALPGGPFDRYLSDKGRAVEPLPKFVVAAPAAPGGRRPLPTPANPALPSLFLIGDSTVRNGQGNGGGGQWGWGEPIAAYFDPAKINVVNRAVGGLSSRTYLTGGYWKETLALIKPGDFVIMQFGHNDSGAINDASRARASLRGVGEETQEIDNLLTRQHEVVHTYGWYLRKYIADAKAKGAAPIVCSPIPRKGFTNGRANRSAGSFGGWAAEVARSEKVPFVDLNEIIARKYDALGPEKVEPLFADPNTHTSLAGAELNAECVIAGLKALTPNPLARYFSAKATAVPAADVRSAGDNPVTNPIYRFDFGSGSAAPGYVAVPPGTLYSKERGYGFEPGASLSAVDRGGPDPLRGDFCTSDRPFFFSVALPEGNYDVTVTLGDQAGETTTTVKAELRRLMLERVHTAPGQFATRTFTVNVRTPEIATGGEVRLKPREKTTEIWNWDDKLTLEFNNTRPCVCALEITRRDAIPTVYLLGDSTVADQPAEPYNSWGQMLPRFFRPGIAVANNAESGESLRSSLGEKRLDKVLSVLKPGDYLFIQFGHNDMKERGEGVGAFTTYKTDLRRYVDEARKKGGIPVVVTSMHRRTFDENGKITNSLGDYPEAVRQVAREAGIALIDLHAMSKPFYEALGPETSKQAFAPGDGTHHNPYGSYELARCVVEGIKTAKLDLARYLADDVQPFDPSRPDPIAEFHIPASPQGASNKPEGS